MYANASARSEREQSKQQLQEVENMRADNVRTLQSTITHLRDQIGALAGDARAASLRRHHVLRAR
jgi:hypothetical protein